MAELVRTDQEIRDVIQWCFEANDNGSHYAGMSYEEGILVAIDWITGVSDDSPVQ